MQLRASLVFAAAVLTIAAPPAADFPDDMIGLGATLDGDKR